MCMRRIVTVSLCIVVTWLTSTVPTVAQSTELDAAFEALAVLEIGQGLDRCEPIRQAVGRSQADAALRSELESRLIAVLQGESTDLAKDYACRQLALVGSDACLDALSQLLDKPHAACMARYALEAIGSPSAAGALRDALDRTAGTQQIGIVISLGRLADQDAAASLNKLLDTDSVPLCEAVVVALGRIGTPTATDALNALSATVPDSLADTLVDARLQAAERLSQRGEYSTAVEIGETLLKSDSDCVRSAAWRVLWHARPESSRSWVLEGLASDDPAIVAVAADVIRELDVAEEVEGIADQVANLPHDGQLAAFVSLRDRSSTAVRHAALTATNQPVPEIRRAALAALITSGQASDLPRLVELASNDPDPAVREAAEDTLRRMTAEGANQKLMELIHAADSRCPLLIRCALARRSPEFNATFLEAAQSTDAATSLAAYEALETMAGPTDAAALARLLSRTPAGPLREAAGRAVWLSCQRIPDVAQQSAPLLDAFEQADSAGRCAILPTLARLGGEAALNVVQSAMQSTESQLRDAGYRALANWPDATVADQLLEIVKTSDVPSYRIWSLRAYVRVVSLPDAYSPDEIFRRLDEAMKMATRIEERRLLVERLGSVRTPNALTRLLAFLDDPQLQNTAIPAVFTSAKGLSQSHPQQAKAALQRIQPLATDPALQQQIPKVLRDIDARSQTNGT